MRQPLNDSLWHQLTQDVMISMRDWRLQHPTASFCEIETELDRRLNHVRARLLEDLALHSTATTWHDAPSAAQPRCPACGTVLQERGQQRRRLQTHGGQDVTLDRSYGVCPACGTGLFPPG